MIRLVLPAALLALAAAVPARGDTSATDPRIKTFALSSTGLLRVPTSPGTIQTILFAQGERVQSVVLTNPDAYKVAITESGDALSLRALGDLPPIIMSVVTDRANYQFELAPSREEAVPTVVRFMESPPGSAVAAANPIPATPPPPQLEGFAYRLGGRPALRPAEISDDGKRTYITWADDQAMPAVFAVGPGGKEEMVDGYMRGKVYTIDRVFPALVFRIDGYSAEASRVRANGKGQARRR